MKNLKLLTFAFVSATILSANPAVMGGITYNFGGNSSGAEGAGATIKVLSSGEDKKAVIAAGLSYFPWAKQDKKLGLDISAGYNIKNSAVMGGWDFLKNQPTISLGYNKEISSNSDGKYAGVQDAVCKNGK